ncbi:MAG: HDIG domain-containing metalloprotein [Pirellulales bacterium]
MSTSGQRRTRIERVAALELPPNFWERLWERVQHGDVWLRVAMCALAAVVMWGVIEGWNPPFPYRTGATPPRDVVAKTSFSVVDDIKTDQAREQARNQAAFVYINDPTPLVQLRAQMMNVIDEIGNTAKFADLRAALWAGFQPPPMENVEKQTPEQQADEFDKLHALVDTKEELASFEGKLAKAFVNLEKDGFFTEPEQLSAKLIGASEPVQGDPALIKTHPPGNAKWPLRINVSQIRKDAAIAELHTQLKEEFGAEIAQLLFNWLKPKLPAKTLTLDEAETIKAREEEAGKIEPVKIPYPAGEADLAKAGEPLQPATIELLRKEYEATLAQRAFEDKLYRSLAVFGMFFALFTLAGFYIYFRNPVLLVDLRKFTRLLVLFMAAVALAMMASGDRLRAEMIPILVFGMTVAIAYNQELALLLTAALGLVIVIALGQDLSAYVILLSASATSILLLGRVRTRSRLIYVGLIAGSVAALTAIGVSVVTNQPSNLQMIFHIVREAHRDFWWTIFAAFLVLGLLPFIEKTFDVLTDLSLFEIGDPSHPLLQELVRRAPGTYNHSINVASLAEAAAEAIGARGLLVRVGAYFHDIGKMLKPGYFVENQGMGANRHESLLPAMSTLVIIAHIKDGADLARQHHLPLPIIEFIQQHHGTTLVEYFYKRASEQSEADPHGGEVDETSFRYPGPKPQTKESAVLMLADASESASRALVDPTPGRIEGLVHDLAMKRLLDGQFDECGVTLQELNAIEDSLIKSLTAVYHGRVKYPDQRTA